MSFVVPLAELEFRASRAGGPGGQHVNKASTRVEVLWDVARSPSLDDAQRARLIRQLGKRVDSHGVLHLTAGERRSQLQNRLAALERLQTIVTAALQERRPRKRTRIPRSAVEARLRTKRRRADIKRARGPADEE